MASLLTSDWHAPDTSFINGLVLAGAQQRERQNMALASMAAQLSAAAEQRRQFDEKMDYERSAADVLAQQFKIKHAFTVGKEAADNAYRDKALGLAHQNYHYDGSTALPDNASGQDPQFTGENMTDPDMGAVPAGPDQTPGAADTIPSIAASLMPWAPFQGSAAMALPGTPAAAPPVAPPPQVAPDALPPLPNAVGGPAASLVPPSNFRPASMPPGAIPSTSNAARMADVTKQLDLYKRQLDGLPLNVAAAHIASMGEKLFQSAGATTPALGPDEFMVGKTLFHRDPSTGAATKVGTSPSAVQALYDPGTGGIWQRRNDGKWVNPEGGVADAPPEGLTKIGGLTDEQKQATAEEALKAKKLADAAIQTRADLQGARKDRDDYNQEAMRARGDMEKLAKAPVTMPVQRGGKWFASGNPDAPEIDRATYDAKLAKFNDWQGRLAAIAARAKQNEFLAAEADKRVAQLTAAAAPTAGPSAPTPAAPSGTLAPPAAPTGAPVGGPALAPGVVPSVPKWTVKDGKLIKAAE